MTSKTTAVDYATTDEGVAKVHLIDEAKSYGKMVRSQERATQSRTLTMAKVCRYADDLGLIRDGRSKAEEGSGSLSVSEVATLAAVNTGYVGRWRTLGQWLRIGGAETGETWDVVARAAKSAKFRDALGKASKASDLPGALKAAGLGADGKTSGKRKAQPDDGSQETPEEKPVTPAEAFQEALKVMRAVEKDPRTDSAAWDEHGAQLLRLIAAGDRRRVIVRGKDHRAVTPEPVAETA